MRFRWLVLLKTYECELLFLFLKGSQQITNFTPFFYILSLDSFIFFARLKTSSAIVSKWKSFCHSFRPVFMLISHSESGFLVIWVF